MKRRIQVFVIGPRGFPDVQGGIERFSEGIYPGLVNLGYDIRAFSIKRFSGQKEWKGIKFIHVPTSSIKFLEKPVYNFFAALHCIFKRPDIIHIHSIASGMFIFLLKIFRLKIIARYNSRDYLHDKWNFLGKIVLKLSERQFMLADYIITNNKSFLEHFRSKGRMNRLEYVPNGIEILPKERYENCFRKFFPELIKNNFILFAGRVTAEKNIESLIRAFMQMNQNDMKLVIAGDTAHNDGYFQSLRKKYSDKQIIFTGKLDREKLNCLYTHCSLFVIPSFSEGTPNVLLEAMSFNCKILASRIPAHLEFSFPEESYFVPSDINELNEKILKKLLNSENENHEKKLEVHKWPAIVEQVHAIHQKILN